MAAAHPAAYLIGHIAMFMPMIDTYTTGLDWIVAGARPSPGLAYFLVVTFLNGTVIEIGRRIRAPATERDGVSTYTSAWGVRAAPAVWLAVLAAAAFTGWLASLYTGARLLTAAVLVALVPEVALPAVRFLRGAGPARASGIEKASGLWTLASYLLLDNFCGPLAGKV